MAQRLAKCLGVYRFCQEGFATRLSCPRLLAPHGMGRQSHHRDSGRGRVALESAGRVVSAHPWQLDVHQDEIGLLRRGQPQADVRGSGRNDPATLALKEGRNQLEVHGVIFHDQNTRPHDRLSLSGQ
jgi:hypothetical protein